MRSDRNGPGIQPVRQQHAGNLNIGRLRAIDGLRGIAALLVVGYHLVGRTSASWATARGYLGVAIFFVLSGFVIALSIGERPISLGFVGRFALRRSIRLDIPYWVSILTAIVLTFVGTWFGGARPHISALQVLAHLVYLQDILGFHELSQAYWTLCLEVQFYLALLLILWLGQALRGRIVTPLFQFVFAGSILASALCNAGILPSIRGLMLSEWWAFGIGAVTCWVVTRNLSRGYLFAALIAVLFIPTASHLDWRLTASLTAMFLFISAQAKRMNAWLCDPLSQFFGRISYSLYLFHPLIGWSAQSFALRYMPQYPALAVGISASILSGWLSYWLIERPTTNLSHAVTVRSPERTLALPVRT